MQLVSRVEITSKAQFRLYVDVEEDTLCEIVASHEIIWSMHFWWNQEGETKERGNSQIENGIIGFSEYPSGLQI